MQTFERTTSMADNLQSVLITGATRGIGLEIAKLLAAQGMALTVTARNKDALDALVPVLTDLGASRVCVVAADLADPSGYLAVIEAHRRHHGTMTALVLNAGVATVGEICDYKATRLDKTMTVNFRSPFLLIQAALPLLRQAATARPDRGAKVVVLSSILGVYTGQGFGAYAASKAALLSLVDTLNAEESAHGVTATAIAPAYVDTDMTSSIRDKIPPEAMIPPTDIAVLVDSLLRLSRRSTVGRIVVGRSATTGYHA
jgi:3-oxoacyl-[acyl-carrier protein] reductase